MAENDIPSSLLRLPFVAGLHKLLIMKLSKLCVARLSRAMMVVFGAQVMAAAMCLMPVSAMAGTEASSMPAGTMAMRGDSCSMHHVMSQSHTRHACPHCDAPDKAFSQIDTTHGLQAQVSVLAVLSVPQDWVSMRESTTPLERILAPPGSASLLYSVNQRIRI